MDLLDTETIITIAITVAVVSASYWYFKVRDASPKVDIHVAPPTAAKKPKKNSQKDEVDENDTTPRIKIFYGTQTGTAEEFSRKLETEGKKFGFRCKAVDLEDYDPEDLSSEKLALFCVATYGEGEPTDNARSFHEWLSNEDLPADKFKGVKFAVFGLGNRTYEKFNSMAKFIDKRMEELGGERIFKLGLGDDDSSLEDDFAAWKRELWPTLCTLFGFDFESVDLGSHANERRFKIEVLADKDNNNDSKEEPLHLLLRKRKEGAPIDAKNPFPGVVVVNRELHTAESDRSCRHLEIFIGKPGTNTPALTYEPGDHLGVYSENDPELVEGICKRLDYQPNQRVNLLNAKEKGKEIFTNVQVKDLLAYWCDLTTPPRKTVIAQLVPLTSDPTEKSKLMELSDSKSTQPYESWVKDAQRTILEILLEFPNVKGLPLEQFLDMVPRLNPRYYSISSSQSKHPLHVHATAVVVNYVTPSGRKHKGVCTTYLSHKRPDIVPIFIRKSNFRLPKQHTTPVIMVGPGTGLAPFRGFIQERQVAHEKQELKEPNTHLFFGCRSPKIDYIYQEELSGLHDKGIIKLNTAFSRHGDKKVYVQHILKENGEQIWKLVNEQKAHFYICGDARNMAKDVHGVLLEVVSKFGGKTKEEAEKYVTELQQTGRYQTDVWY